MRRALSYIFAVTGVALAVACSDTGAPTRATAPGLRGASFSVDGVSNGQTFTISSDAGATQIGMFDLRWSANAIACVGDPCVAPTGPVTITTQLRSNSDGHWVIFSPHVEFNSGAQVVLSTSVYKGLINSLLSRGYSTTDPVWQRFNIKAASDLSDMGVVDAPTTIDFLTGTVSRPVSHFSGYVVTSGFSCDTSTDPGCGSSDSGTVIQ